MRMTDEQIKEQKLKYKSLFKVGDTITIKKNIERCYTKGHSECPFADSDGCVLTDAMLLPGDRFVISDLYFRPNSDGKPHWELHTESNGYYLEGCVEQQDEDNEI